jgi:hypothetical protein
MPLTILAVDDEKVVRSALQDFSVPVRNGRLWGLEEL